MVTLVLDLSSAKTWMSLEVHPDSQVRPQSSQHLDFRPETPSREPANMYPDFWFMTQSDKKKVFLKLQDLWWLIKPQ